MLDFNLHELYATVTTDNTTTFLGHCRSLFAILRSRYLSRHNLTKRSQRSDELVRAFTAELSKLVMFCDYPTAEVNERLKENLIINMYSTKIHKKLFTLPDDTELKDVIKTMETLEQAA